MKNNNKALIAAGCTPLSDNSTHQHRFEICSETSNNMYIVSQAKATGEWQCGCKGWIFKRPGKERTCKHLRALLPLLLAATSDVKKIG